jgi:DNA-directed RNA polymerase subunit E'/Rpb7
MELIQIDVYISPSDFSNVHQAIYKQIVNYTSTYCNQENGYIINHTDVIDIIPGKISGICEMVMFLVSFKVKYFKPESGMSYSGTLVGKYELGLIATIAGKVKVFVPTKHVNEYDYDNCIPIRILETRYKQNNIDCIGEIII